MGEKYVCGHLIVQQPTWTQANPGRRFMACVDCRCNLSLRWLEDPERVRAQVIIPGLIRSINNLEYEKAAMVLASEKTAIKKTGRGTVFRPLHKFLGKK